MELKFREQTILNITAPTNVDTTAVVELGTTAKAIDIDPTTLYGEVELIYLQANAAEAVGSVSQYHGSYIAALAGTGSVGQVAVSISTKAANEYGWYVIRGNVPALVAAGFGIDVKCFLTAVPGTIDDVPVTGNDIFAAKSLTAIGTPSAGLAVITVNNSFVLDGVT